MNPSAAEDISTTEVYKFKVGSKSGEQKFLAKGTTKKFSSHFSNSDRLGRGSSAPK